MIPDWERSVAVGVADTTACSDDTVISPAKIAMSESSVRADAVPSVSLVLALTEVDPAETIEPSAG